MVPVIITKTTRNGKQFHRGLRMDFEILTYGKTNAETLLIQMVDDHDLEVIEREIALIRELSGEQDFCLKAIKVHSWNDDLSPWQSPAVFGKEGFGGGAARTLEFLRDSLLSHLPDGDERLPDGERRLPGGDGQKIRKIFLGGYSLAGLFALWAGYQTDCFDGIAAASPSIWFTNFTDYMKENRIGTEAVYLSLGDKEEKVRNPVMSRVGNAIREAEAILRAEGRRCVLEWNKGNHFKEPDLRTAKGFAWLMNL